MKVDALLFAFGGTLDTDGVNSCERYWELYRELGLRVDRSLFAVAFAEAENRFAQQVPAEACGLRALIERQVHYQIDFLHAEATNFRGSPEQAAWLTQRAYEGAVAALTSARPVLEGLGQRLKLAVVANFYGNLEQVLDEVGLRAPLAAVVDSARAGVRKPDPEIFRVALRELGLVAERSAVVGDSYARDIVSGKAAGCRTIWLRGRSSRGWSDTSQADLIVASLREIPARLAV